VTERELRARLDLDRRLAAVLRVGVTALSAAGGSLLVAGWYTRMPQSYFGAAIAFVTALWLSKWIREVVRDIRLLENLLEWTDR